MRTINIRATIHALLRVVVNMIIFHSIISCACGRYLFDRTGISLVWRSESGRSSNDFVDFHKVLRQFFFVNCFQFRFVFHHYRQVHRPLLRLIIFPIHIHINILVHKRLLFRRLTNSSPGSLEATVLSESPFFPNDQYVLYFAPQYPLWPVNGLHLEADSASVDLARFIFYLHPSPFSFITGFQCYTYVFHNSSFSTLRPFPTVQKSPENFSTAWFSYHSLQWIKNLTLVTGVIYGTSPYLIFNQYWRCLFGHCVLGQFYYFMGSRSSINTIDLHPKYIELS